MKNPSLFGHQTPSIGVKESMHKQPLIFRAFWATCFVVLFSSAAFGQDGLELLHRMQRALGGADRMAAVRDFEMSERGNVWTEAGRLIGEVRKRTRWIGQPNLLRVDQAGPGNTYVLYFDGTSGWEIPPERGTSRTTGAVIDLVGEELEFAKGYLSGFMLEYWRGLWLADRIPGYTITSPAPNVVRISRQGQARDITLDPATWLPVKQGSISSADTSGPIPPETHFTEWTEVEGIRFPAGRSTHRNGAKITEGRAEEIRVNSGLKPEDLAAKPADFSPVISRSYLINTFKLFGGCKLCKLA